MLWTNSKKTLVFGDLGEDVCLAKLPHTKAPTKRPLSEYKHKNIELLKDEKNQPQDHIYIYISTGWSAFSPLQAPLETKKNEKRYSTIYSQRISWW
jgi:hypothetical protein